MERLPSVLLEEGQSILSVPIQDYLAESQRLLLGDPEYEASFHILTTS